MTRSKERTRVVVIGAGRWGPNLIRNFHVHPGSTVVGVADSDPKRLELLAERYPGMRVAAEAATLINDPGVDAVVICTPTVTHFELAEKALRAGKHVFVEKPLATSSALCEDLIELAEEKKRVLFVGHVFVYNSAIQAVRETIRSGELGRLYHVQITRTNLGPVRSDVSALWDLGAHDLAILRYWLGEDPVSVSAVGGRYLSAKLEDTVFATFSYPSGMLANLHVSWLNPKKVREITVVGDRKMLVWDDMSLSRPIQLYDKNITIDPMSDRPPAGHFVDTIGAFRASIHDGTTTAPAVAANEPLAAECAAFLRALEDPASSLSTGEDGRAVVAALEAADRSLREGGRGVRIR